MGWKFSATGTLEDLRRALDAEDEMMPAESKVEFEAAKPHLRGLLSLGAGKSSATLHIEASGGAYERDNQPAYSTCNVKIVPARDKA